MGKANPASVVLYMLAMLSLILFNTFKVHRACIEHMLIRLILELIWSVLAVGLLINLIRATPVDTLYALRE